MTEPDVRLRAALMEIAKDAPERGPSAAALLATHRRRARRVRAASAAALTVATIGAVGAVNAVNEPRGQGRIGGAAASPSASPSRKTSAPPAVVADPPATPPELADGWSGVRGSLAGDGTTLAALRKRAADLFIKGVPYNGGDREGQYINANRAGRHITVKDLRILIAGDVGKSRVVLLAGPAAYEPKSRHSDLFWLSGKAGATPDDLMPAACPEPQMCFLGLDRTGGPSKDRFADGGYLVAASVGSTVTLEVAALLPKPGTEGVIRVAAHPEVLAIATPVEGIAGLYQVPPQPRVIGYQSRLPQCDLPGGHSLAEQAGAPVPCSTTPPDTFVLVIRNHGKLQWYEPL